MTNSGKWEGQDFHPESDHNSETNILVALEAFFDFYRKKKSVQSIWHMTIPNLQLGLFLFL